LDVIGFYLDQQEKKSFTELLTLKQAYETGWLSEYLQGMHYPHEIFKYLYDRFGSPRRELSEKTGIKESRIKNIISAGSPPTGSEYITLLKGLGFSFDPEEEWQRDAYEELLAHGIRTGLSGLEDVYLDVVLTRLREALPERQYFHGRGRDGVLDMMMANGLCFREEELLMQKHPLSGDLKSLQVTNAVVHQLPKVYDRGTHAILQNSDDELLRKAERDLLDFFVTVQSDDAITAFNVQDSLGQYKNLAQKFYDILNTNRAQHDNGMTASFYALARRAQGDASVTDEDCRLKLIYIEDRKGDLYLTTEHKLAQFGMRDKDYTVVLDTTMNEDDRQEGIEHVRDVYTSNPDFGNATGEGLNLSHFEDLRDEKGVFIGNSQGLGRSAISRPTPTSDQPQRSKPLPRVTGTETEEELEAFEQQGYDLKDIAQAYIDHGFRTEVTATQQLVDYFTTKEHVALKDFVGHIARTFASGVGSAQGNGTLLSKETQVLWEVVHICAEKKETSVDQLFASGKMRKRIENNLVHTSEDERDWRDFLKERG